MTLAHTPARVACSLLTIATSLFAMSPAAAQWNVTGKSVPQLVAFDNAMQTVMTNHNIPNGQMAVTYQGRLVLARGYTRNPGAGDIVTQPDSLFRIASLSKPLTSVLINRLVQENRMSLTSTLNQFVNLTPLPGRVTDARLATITVRNLLEHRAGFGNVPTTMQDPMFADREIATASGVGLPISKANIITYMNGVPLNSNPGSTEYYSNYGYLLLGRIIESVTGMSYTDYAMSVLRTIGVWDMRQGKTELSGRAPREVQYSAAPYTYVNVMNNSGAVVPYAYGGFNIENMDAHGGWIASAIEMLRWSSNLDTPASPTALLNQTSLNRMFGLPQNYPLPYQPGDPYYAQGWNVRDYGNGLNTYHSGSLGGTSTYAVRTRNAWDYVVLLNRRDETGQSSYTLEVDNAMWSAFSQITTWPSGDLFGEWLPVVFRAGFD